VKESTTFCEQKVVKNFVYSGPWAVSATKPMAQHNKNFGAAFLKIGCLLKNSGIRFDSFSRGSGAPSVGAQGRRGDV
jgi:hypothetical protein